MHILEEGTGGLIRIETSHGQQATELAAEGPEGWSCDLLCSPNVKIGVLHTRISFSSAFLRFFLMSYKFSKVRIMDLVLTTN